MDASLDAEALRGLRARWDALAAGPGSREALRALESAVEAHRSRLFTENAMLQAEGELPGSDARIESNALAIKWCTVALAEVRAALGALGSREAGSAAGA